MKVELFPFQKTALAKLRQNVAIALGNYQSTHTPQVVSYTAPTGAGKTIVMSALIESIFTEMNCIRTRTMRFLSGFRIRLSSMSNRD